MFVPYVSCEPSSTPNFLHKIPTLVYDDDSEGENSPPLVALGKLLPQCSHSTCEMASDLIGDSRDQCWTHSQFQQTTSVLDQVL